MPNDDVPITDYKRGGYSIKALSTETYTFWWGAGSANPNEYFDVFVAPENDREHTTIQPLTVVSKQIGYDTTGSFKVIVFLTLRNDNDFVVNFIANHIRIYLGTVVIEN
jgi:hypothetical protein